MSLQNLRLSQLSITKGSEVVDGCCCAEQIHKMAEKRLYICLERNVQIILLDDPPEPQCRCELDGTLYDFCYHLPPEPRTIGRRFDCANAVHLERLGLLSAEHILDVKKERVS
ncbi:hypothetical protein OSTOST_18045 [Ostertagia ostertagi]